VTLNERGEEESVRGGNESKMLRGSSSPPSYARKNLRGRASREEGRGGEERGEGSCSEADVTRQGQMREGRAMSARLRKRSGAFIQRVHLKNDAERAAMCSRPLTGRKEEKGGENKENKIQQRMKVCQEKKEGKKRQGAALCPWLRSSAFKESVKSKLRIRKEEANVNDMRVGTGRPRMD